MMQAQMAPTPFAAAEQQQLTAATLQACPGLVDGLARSLSSLAVQLSSRLCSQALAAAAAAGVSGPQGAVRPFTMVADPAAWRAADLAGEEEQLFIRLSSSDVTALDAAVAALEAAGTPLTNLKRPADFPLPESLTAKLEALKRQLLSGRGLGVLRGLPVDRWTERQSVAAYLGLAAHIGYRGPQSKDGKLVNHVKMHYPAGVLPSQCAAPVSLREHAHNLEFGWHTDGQADVLALLCLRQAAEGGESGFASALAVHNEMLARGRADLVACLAGTGWFRDRTRYQDLAPGEALAWEMPVFAHHAGRLVCHYNSTHYRLCDTKYGGACTLSPLQLEAMEMFESIASQPEFRFATTLAPGDAAFLNNEFLLHSRSAFRDGDAPAQRRHLVRLWLALPGGPSRPAHLDFPRSYSVGYERAAFRGLMRPDPSTFHVPLSAEADDV